MVAAPRVSESHPPATPSGDVDRGGDPDPCGGLDDPPRTLTLTLTLVSLHLPRRSRSGCSRTCWRRVCGRHDAPHRLAPRARSGARACHRKDGHRELGRLDLALARHPRPHLPGEACVAATGWRRAGRSPARLALLVGSPGLHSRGRHAAPYQAVESRRREGRHSVVWGEERVTSPPSCACGGTQTPHCHEAVRSWCRRSRTG
jgi:hypothetical protein